MHLVYLDSESPVDKLFKMKVLFHIVKRCSL